MLRKIILPLIAMFAISCNTNDDGFYNETYVEAENNLVVIEQQPSYNVDDVLFVNAIVPRLLQQKDFTNLLDIRQSTGNADRFNFTIVLEKKVAADTWEYVDLTNKFVLGEGGGTAGAFIKGTLIYNNSLEEYRLRCGISLTETGEYRMSFGVTSSSNKTIELRSQSPEQNLQMNIKTSAAQVDASGRYNFLVN